MRSLTQIQFQEIFTFIRREFKAMEPFLMVHEVSHLMLDETLQADDEQSFLNFLGTPVAFLLFKMAVERQLAEMNPRISHHTHLEEQRPNSSWPGYYVVIRANALSFLGGWEFTLAKAGPYGEIDFLSRSFLMIDAAKRLPFLFNPSFIMLTGSDGQSEYMKERVVEALAKKEYDEGLKRHAVELTAREELIKHLKGDGKGPFLHDSVMSYLRILAHQEQKDDDLWAFLFCLDGLSKRLYPDKSFHDEDYKVKYNATAEERAILLQILQEVELRREEMEQAKDSIAK